ncbi:citrate synthase 1 [Alicyclobacillus contaminans]|uniref:citrate synthase n=1 Tax=Alicyclobacillus contaminans TaxID=392016 RepID=UPI0003FA7132|nr:citrate synthase [Alicyclobacillus contaminans]GMA50582.1 citrate synthase 1 [Alicyclobacillus contaminans]
MASTNGLEHVVAAQTDLSLVDGTAGRLVYRGHFAQDLAQTRSFEEVAHLLWAGRLPNPAERAALVDELRSQLSLPEYVKHIIQALPPEQSMMDVLRTAISALGAAAAWPPTLADAKRLTAAMPSIIAHRQAFLEHRAPVTPHPDLGYAANYLYMLSGEVPSPEKARALEAYLIITMEHGMNASTFAARVVTSTQSDMASALAAALGAMKGPLHGGAPAEVMSMLEEIGTAENAEPWLRQALERGERLMGFGHRVYKTRDPRAVALRSVVQGMRDEDPLFNLSVVVEDTAIRLLNEYKPGRQLYSNVEYWAAAILRTVNMPKPLYTPTFSVSRAVGWTAHILEQAAGNRLIRPQSEYVGPLPIDDATSLSTTR